PAQLVCDVVGQLPGRAGRSAGGSIDGQDPQDIVEHVRHVLAVRRPHGTVTLHSVGDGRIRIRVVHVRGAGGRVDREDLALTLAEPGRVALLDRERNRLAVRTPGRSTGFERDLVLSALRVLSRTEDLLEVPGGNVGDIHCLAARFTVERRLECDLLTVR